jgi:hypothetical protein
MAESLFSRGPSSFRYRCSTSPPVGSDVNYPESSEWYTDTSETVQVRKKSVRKCKRESDNEDRYGLAEFLRRARPKRRDEPMTFGFAPSRRYQHGFLFCGLATVRKPYYWIADCNF